jgi:hypothetical protein
MQPLLVPAMPEILHLQMKPSSAKMSASNTAWSGSTDTSDTESFAPVPRSKTVGAINSAELDMEYPSLLTSRDSDDFAPIRRSKTAPGLDAFDVGKDYPTGLVVRNTFLEFPLEQPLFLEVQRSKSAPSSPMASRTDFAPPATVLELSNLLQASLGSSELPTVGSAEHQFGECKPCAFFWKQDGCGNGVNCLFCHLCGPDEKKRRQKEKKANKANLKHKLAGV